MNSRFDPSTVPDRPVALESGADLAEFVDAYSPALVQFETDGCGKCAAMGPVLGGIARGTDTAVATINPRDDPPLIDRYRVTSVPTLVAFVDGEERDRLADGFVSGDDLLGFLEDLSGSAGV